MKAMHRNSLGVGGIVVASILMLTPASGQTRSAPLPAAVKEAVRGLDETCREEGKGPDRTLSYVKRIDVTGDKIPDYVIDDSEYMCGTTPYVMVGATGLSSVSVFVADAKGGAVLAYDDWASMGIRVGKSPTGDSVALVVVDRGCGRAVNSDGNCERPLRWNASTRKMSFGPPQLRRP